MFPGSGGETSRDGGWLTMFVNRLIKELHNDVLELSGKATNPASFGPFLFPTKDRLHPEIEINGHKIPAAEFFYVCLTNKDCQFFEFGEIGNDAIKRESKTVAEGYEAGLIDLPADVCWMEHQWQDWHGPVTSGYLYMKKGNGIFGAEIRRLPTEAVIKDAQGRINSVIKNDFDGERQSNFESLVSGRSEYFIWDGMLLLLPPLACSTGYSCGVTVNTSGAAVNPNNVFDPLMSMLGRLNADGITQEHISSPSKLNRRRASKGLPGVVAYTKVKIKPSRPVLGRSGPLSDDRLSPRYHFRRGHVRHFQNGERTWVRPCFIGSPEDGEIRHTYEISEG